MGNTIIVLRKTAGNIKKNAIITLKKTMETSKKNSMLLALIVVAICFTVGTEGKLLNPQNITNLISQNGYVVVLTVGMLMCILTGGNIDLSVGSVVALVGAIAGDLIVNRKMNIWVAIIISLLAGLLIGVWQGFWIAYARIPAFIVTLAGMLLWRGVALKVLGGLTINPFPEKYQKLFNSFVPDVFDRKINIICIIIGIIVCVAVIIMQIAKRIHKKNKGYQQENFVIMLSKTIIICAVILTLSYMLAKHNGFPVILILLSVIVIVYTFITTKTVPGRHLYAFGGNEKAAKLSGIKTNRVLFLAYVNMSFLSGVAALMCIARFNSAAPTAGNNYELDAIGACFVGGASAYGGIGTVPGVVIGAIFMGVINNGMSMMSIDTNLQKAIKGIVLLAAVVFDVVSKKRKRG